MGQGLSLPPIPINNRLPCRGDRAFHQKSVNYNYDEQIHDKIVALDDKHHNAIPIFSGALWASKYITDTFDLSQFASYLPTVAQNAKFYKWHGGIVGRFAHSAQ